MTKLDQDRYIAGKQAAHAAANVPALSDAAVAHSTLLRWRYGRGVSVDVGEIPEVVASALGLVATGYRPGQDPEGEPVATQWLKPEGSTNPDEVRVDRLAPPARRCGPVALDGTVMPEGTCEADRWDGLRQIVARECDVDDRRGEGGVRYYAEKYPAFVRLGMREMEGKQRAAALAAGAFGKRDVFPPREGK